VQDFYLALADQTAEADTVLEQYLVRNRKGEGAAQASEAEESGSLFAKFVNTARDIASGISVLGMNDNFMHQYAKCCNPIPGDLIVGFVTTGEGIKIHRKDCRNVVSLRLAESARIVEVGWPPANEADFIAGVHVSGEDRPGLLNDVTHAISTVMNTNIRSVNMDSKGAYFDGQVILYVKDIDHLAKIIEKLRRVPGVTLVERFTG